MTASEPRGERGDGSEDGPPLGVPAEFRRIEDDDGRPLLVARGEIDVYTSPDFRSELYALAEHGDDPVVVDLSGVTFIDSSGLGVLVGALKRVRRRDGTIELRGLVPATHKVLEITGLTKLFTIVD